MQRNPPPSRDLRTIEVKPREVRGSRADIEVKLTGDRLTIGGKREAEREDKDDTYYAYERCFGSFLRTFTLPDGFDGEHVLAELKDGVLTVVVPKKPVAHAKTIAVKGPAFKKS